MQTAYRNFSAKPKVTSDSEQPKAITGRKDRAVGEHVRISARRSWIYFVCEINTMYTSMSTRPRLILLLNSAHRRLQLWTATEQERAAGAAGAAPSPAQGGVLFILLKNDGATMGELSHALDLVPSAVSGLVQRMETFEWVRRRPCPRDGRTQRVWLQPAGTEQLPALHKALSRINSELAQGFTEAELQTVGRWLHHVQRLGIISTD